MFSRIKKINDTGAPRTDLGIVHARDWNLGSGAPVRIRDVCVGGDQGMKF